MKELGTLQCGIKNFIRNNIILDDDKVIKTAIEDRVTIELNSKI